MSPAIGNFLRCFSPGKAMPEFDIGTGGRKIIDMVVMSLQPKKRDAGEAARDVALVLCNDVLLICAQRANGGYELVTKPIDRLKVNIEDSMSSNWDSPCFIIKNHGQALTLEAPSEHVKMEWIRLLRDRTGYVPTDKLEGDRLVAREGHTRDHLTRKLDIPDPFTDRGRKALTEEFKLIPTVGFNQEELLKSNFIYFWIISNIISNTDSSI